MIDTEVFNDEERALKDREMLDAMHDEEQQCEDVVNRVARGTATIEDARFLVNVLGLSLKL